MLSHIFLIILPFYQWLSENYCYLHFTLRKYKHREAKLFEQGHRANNKVRLDFKLNDKNKVVVNEFCFTTNDGDVIDLKNDIEGMTLNQVSILLREYKLIDVKRYVDQKNKELSQNYTI